MLGPMSRLNRPRIRTLARRLTPCAALLFMGMAGAAEAASSSEATRSSRWAEEVADTLKSHRSSPNAAPAGRDVAPAGNSAGRGAGSSDRGGDPGGKGGGDRGSASGNGNQGNSGGNNGGGNGNGRGGGRD